MHPDFNITAILAWGSLTWEPKDLNFIKDVGWKNYGPTLPIEFARISNNGRLTLVISENGTPVTTYFALGQLYIKYGCYVNLVVVESQIVIIFRAKDTFCYIKKSPAPTKETGVKDNQYL